ncbi:MAG: 6-phosphofructokinase, partial [Candidatus Anammoxibacter sp.]
TIGGDDTVFTASELERLSDGKLEIVHVPKTIDNDLPLPDRLSTFGFQTARHVGVNIVSNIMEDSKTTGRWYLVVTMGRKAGHLAIGICKSAGATVAIIPEEFKNEKINMSSICDIIEGSILKRLAVGRDYGVVILAEGLALKFDEAELKGLKNVEHDEHGNVRISEIDLGKIIKEELKKRLKSIGLDITIIDKNIGYELRCAPPIPFDKELTRDLGYGAVKFLMDGGTGAIVTIVGGKIKPLYFKDVIDPATGKTSIRLVDVNTESYEVARKYMIRLNKEDFENEETIANIAKVANLSKDDFIKKFGYLGK